MWKHNPFVVSRPFWTYAPGNNPDSRKSTISTRNAFAFFFDKNTHSNGPKLKINRGRIQSENRVYVTSKSILVNKCYSNHHFPNRQFGRYLRRSAPRYFLVCGLAQVKCLSQGSPLKHDGRRKTTKRKKRAKGFQGFLYGTSGGRNSKGSSPGPPGRKNKNKNFKKIKTGTYH